MTLALERALDAAPAGWEWTPLGTLIDQVEDAGDFAALMARPGGAPPLPDGSRNMNPPGLSFRKLVAEDFRTNDADIFHQGFLMLLVHRFGNRRMDVRPKLLRAPLTIVYRFLNKMTQILFGMKLDYTVKVGRRVKLEHFGGMILGAREIGNDVVIRQNTTFGIRSIDDLRAKPIIGDFVDIGAGAVIVGNVTVGENSIIGANSVVFTNVPPDSVVMGVPGKVIGPNRRQNGRPAKPAQY
jgi:serine O-acetyltransferase